jgi:hypothetical protein
MPLAKTTIGYCALVCSNSAPNHDIVCRSGLISLSLSLSLTHTSVVNWKKPSVGRSARGGTASALTTTMTLVLPSSTYTCPKLRPACQQSVTELLCAAVVWRAVEQQRVVGEQGLLTKADRYVAVIKKASAIDTMRLCQTIKDELAFVDRKRCVAHDGRGSGFECESVWCVGGYV